MRSLAIGELENMLWQVMFSGKNSAYVSGICLDLSGNICFGGWAGDSSALARYTFGGSRFFLAKSTSSGSIISIFDCQDGIPVGMRTDSSVNCYVSARFVPGAYITGSFVIGSNPYEEHSALMRFDPDLSFVWGRYLGSSYWGSVEGLTRITRLLISLSRRGVTLMV